MGIKIKNVYDKVVSPENLYRSAHRTLLKGLRYKENGAGWKLHMEYHINKIHRQLTDFTYRHGKYQVFKVYDPKERTILAASITDRLVHHALHDVIEPIVDRKFINHSYACRLGKGQHRGMKAARHMLRKYRYVIHLDVKKYFYSIHRTTLSCIVQRTIQDEGISWLLSEIIDSSIRHPFAGQQSYGQQQLRLFDAVGTPPACPDHERGIPIGNLTSQLLANWYLNELDQFVLHKLKHKAYIRYMDDFVLFDDSHSVLAKLESEITLFCREHLRLQLHPSGGAMPYRQGLTFLGFRIFRDHIRLKSASAARFRKKLAHATDHLPWRTKAGFEALHRFAQAWNAHSSHGDTFGLRSQVFGKYDVTRYMMDNEFDIKKMNKQLAWN